MKLVDFLRSFRFIPCNDTGMPLDPGYGFDNEIANAAGSFLCNLTPMQYGNEFCETEVDIFNRAPYIKDSCGNYWVCEGGIHNWHKLGFTDIVSA